MGGVLLGLVVVALGAPGADGQVGEAVPPPDLKLAEPWCEGREGQEAATCVFHCGRHPVDEQCHLLKRFGLSGVLVREAAQESGVPVTVAATAFGLSEKDGHVLAVLYDAFGWVPLPVTREQQRQVATADRLRQHGVAYHSQGHYRECAEASEQAASLYRDALGQLHPGALAARNNQGQCLSMDGQYEAAQALLMRGVRDAERLYGPDHPELGVTLNNLGSLYRALGAYRVVDPEAKGIKFVPRLLAFVVKPVEGERAEDGTPACRYHRVELGPSKPLAEAYGDWREAVGEAEACFGRHGRPEDCGAVFSEMDQKGAALRALAWDPVVAEDGGVPWLAEQGRILVVPDGPLAGVPLGALPASEGRYLVEDHEFTVLSYPAAVTLPEPSLSDLRERDRGALVVGDINYNWGLAPAEAGQYVRRCDGDGCQKVGSEDKQGIDSALDRRTEQTEIEIPDFGPLSGVDCGPEYAAWSKLVSRSHTKSRNDGSGESEVSRLDHLAMDIGRALRKPSELIAGQMASEHLVTARMSDRPIIHLQTHGYSITDQACAERHARIKPRQLPGASPSLVAFESDETVFDPHRLSGLVFAARNTHAASQNTKRESDPAWQPEPDEARNDGLLRARDVLNLNLSKTWLVVLAACQTGLGRQLAGEGALGLGRAFLIAGARYAVVSQWQVPFHATNRMFTAFYGHVVAGVAPPTALRKVQVAVIAELRKAGVHHSGFIWGAFSPLVGYGQRDGPGSST